jgi:FkbM family methyltransferase
VLVKVTEPSSRIEEALPERVKHWARLALNAEYRRQASEKRRLRMIPRYTRTHTNLLGRSLELVDPESFLSMYDQIFVRQIYRFETSNDAPVIIDGGANIGMSVLYFKELYPRSRIIAFEPDPAVFQTLKTNLDTFRLKGVELVPRALWTDDTDLEFTQEGGEAGRLRRTEDPHRKIRVAGARLKNYLDRQVDLLKLDIEGAETNVLRDCVDELPRVQRLFVEYHSFADDTQTLHELLSLLHDAGFRMHIHSVRPSPQPFVKRFVNFGMDFQANIFAFRS